MKGIFRISVSVFAMVATSHAMAEEPDMKVFHFESGGVDCYRMEHSGRKPVEEVVIGATWDGHPISDDMNVKVVKKPSGWKARIEEKARYGYQYIVLDAPEPDSYKDVPRGNLGHVCILFSGSLKEASTLPYKYSMRDYPSFIIGTVTPGSKADHDDLGDLLGDEASEKLEKLDKAKRKVDKLKQLKDVF